MESLLNWNVFTWIGEELKGGHVYSNDKIPSLQFVKSGWFVRPNILWHPTKEPKTMKMVSGVCFRVLGHSPLQNCRSSYDAVLQQTIQPRLSLPPHNDSTSEMDTYKKRKRERERKKWHPDIKKRGGEEGFKNQEGGTGQKNVQRRVWDD